MDPAPSSLNLSRFPPTSSHLVLLHPASPRPTPLLPSHAPPALWPPHEATPQAVHGYTVLRLDEHDNRREFTEEGWDRLSYPGTIAGLDRFAAANAAADTARSK